MKRFVCLLLIAVVGFTAVPIISQGGSQVAWAEEFLEKESYKFENAGVYGRFTNYVDGYSLLIDKSMKVDMSNSAVCAVLENNEKRIEIYKQYVGKNGKASYINYSNKFLANKTDHFLEYNAEQKIGRTTAHLTVWHRNKLARVQNDKNYYMTIDIKEGNYVYTIFIKAAFPIYSLGGYAYLMTQFTTFTPLKAGELRVAQINNNKEWNEETQVFFNKYFWYSKKLTWGMFQPNTARFDYSKINGYEKYLNYKFPIMLHYTAISSSQYPENLRKHLDTAYQNGKVMELTLQTTWKGGSNMVYDVLNGNYDAYLNNYAKDVAQFSHPVMFRLGNEMNGDWCPYSSHNTSKDTQIYKEFYRYIYKIFKNNGANNVIWVWNPNGTSFPDFKWNNEMMYYPGDEYVDVIGLTAYNTGTYYYKTGERWKEFDELYKNMYNRYSSYFNQPLMITEFSSASQGGDKNLWVQNMFNVIKNYPRIKIAVWWDGHDLDPANGNIARAYYFDEPQSVMETFRKNINN